ncbi:MAG: hypothetical protein WC028_13215 [Candidatus Obscuribacterales bacterium]
MTGFIYTPAILDRLELTLSAERLSTYQAQASGNRELAIKLYCWNIALSETLYGPVQSLEVVVRNALHERLTAAFGTTWYDIPASGLAGHLIDRVSAAKDSLTSQGKPHTSGRLIAELNFGFWLGVLTKHYDTGLWRPHLYHAFPNARKPFRRSDAYQALDRIRRLRNRIAHHEPILTRPLDADHAVILEVVGWICPETAAWINNHSRFNEVWKKRPT